MFPRVIKYLLIAVLIALFSVVTFAQAVFNWFPAPSGMNVNLNGVTNDYCVGSSGVILRTTNNGYGWVLENSGTSRKLNCVVNYSNISLAAGDLGTIVRNEGAGWVLINSGVINNLYGITSTFVNDYYVVGETGTILFSTNSGLNWTRQQSPVPSLDLNSVYAIAGFAWAAGTGMVLKTTNSGSNWIYAGVPLAGVINSVFFKDINTGWIVGSGGVIFKSQNGGSNWIRQENGGYHEDLKSVFFTTLDTGWTCGANGFLLKTTNGGTNWIFQTPLGSSNLNSIYFLDRERAYSVGDMGKIFVRRFDSLYLPYCELAANNVSSWFNYFGVFDNDIRTANTPGFEWPISSGKRAVFSAGLTIAAKVNSSLRMATAFYNGEYRPGYVSDSSGYKVGKTDSRFRFYKVSRGDNMSSNPSWANWGFMVPFGAPYIDVNHSNVYEPAIDTPGIRGASQTIFICLTDGFTSAHNTSSGFGGGTAPLYAELHMTAWCYDNPGYQDMQFIRWDIINKSNFVWDSTRISIISDPDLGYAGDDYIGCDTLRNLGYCYNADNDDAGGSYSYGLNPPAFGFKLLNCPLNPALMMKSFVYPGKVWGPVCEMNANGDPSGAYNYMKGVKKDGTPWVIPNTNPPQITKFCYSGDPESNTGWTEYGGRVLNCGGSLTGQLQVPVPVGDRRLIINMVEGNLVMHPGDTQKVQIAQLIARGTSNINSVTKLKQLSEVAQRLCDSGFVIGINQISSQVPGYFKLYQNYPNPFNPITNIKYDVAFRTKVKITIYDINGREVKTLVNEVQSPGHYTADWDGSNNSSGVYFYRIETETFMDSKKMVLIK